MRVITLGTFVVLLTVTPLNAQSARTCVAYMEADETFEGERKRAVGFGKELDRLIAAALGKRQMLMLSVLHGRERSIVLDDMVRKLPKKQHDGLMRKARGIEKKVAAVIHAARTERYNAYRIAYRGPTSDVRTVMARLMDKDRRRCRYR